MTETPNFKDDLEKITGDLLREPVPRGHLGASQVGTRCAREAWLQFRWAGEEQVEGRMRRLWNRGHEEEHRVARWLRAMGIELRDYAQRLVWYRGDDYEVRYETIPWDEPVPDWAEDVSTNPHHIAIAKDEYGVEPKQWGFVDHNGHYAGSGDGKLFGLEKWYPEVTGLGWGLFENKTMNDKSFNETVKKGVKASKPIYWHQMQQYMLKLGLKWAFFVSVNKNDDNIYTEVVMLDEVGAKRMLHRAGQIIRTRQAPPKITEDPSWFECRFCAFREQCHYDAALDNTNCRSCIFAEPDADGEWRCNKFNQIIPRDFIPQGCQQWEPCL